MTDPTTEAPEGTGERPEPAAPAEPQTSAAALVEEDLLVEEISIDGMCGVY
jgi:mycofactocin precursor